MVSNKKIKVYAEEKELGLEEVILANSSFACEFQLEIADEFDISRYKESIRATAGEAVGDDYTLHYLKSIMVSTGANKNDDVFLPAELWKARHTPEDKPFNYEHDQDDVIGHITANVCILDNGEVIPDDTQIDDLPEEFHILATSVLYKEWKTEEKQERMNEILADIKEGKRSVSMECILTNFDYLLIENEGSKKAIASIVPRKKNTAYLTKHLRIYGGTGMYEGKKVKRVLRDITFSGKGLVTNPANPKSIILNTIASADSVYNITSENKESSMAENLLEKENVELKAEVASLKATLKDNDQKVLTEAVASAKASVKELSDKNEKLEKDLANATASLKEVSTSKVELEAALAKIENENRINSRVNAVATSLSLDAEKAKVIVASLAKLDDEEFASYVKTQAEYEAEKMASYMKQGGTPASTGGDPMSKGGVKVSGSKPTEPTPLKVYSTPGAKTYDAFTVNLAKNTAPVNLPAGVTASVTVDPAEPNANVSLDSVKPDGTPALAASVSSVNEVVENRRRAIAAYMNKGKEEVKESK